MAHEVNSSFYFMNFNRYLLCFLFRLGATIPSKPQPQTGSAKMDTEDHTHASSSTSEPTTEPPKAESDPESELG